MSRTKNRSKAKSASARTRVERGQDGASESAFEVARRENESSLAAKLPVKVLERIINILCPSTFGFEDCKGALEDCRIKHDALSFALVCTSWRDVGIARFWQRVSVPSRGPIQAPVLAARSRQGLVRELEVMCRATGPQAALLRTRVDTAAACVGQDLQALYISGPEALKLVQPALSAGRFSSLADLRVGMQDPSPVVVQQVYEAFAHLPELKEFDFLVQYRSPNGTLLRPRMPAPRRRLSRFAVRFHPTCTSSICYGRIELSVLAGLLYVADLSGLRELRLNYSVSHAIPAQLAPHLRHLRILRLVVAPVLFPSLPAALTSILADLPNLVALDVEIAIFLSRDIGIIPPSDAAALLAALPLSLEVALVELDFTQPGSAAHLAAFLERRLASGVLKRWTSVRGTRPDATLKTTWRRYGGGGEDGEDGGARWETEDFEESDASARLV
ncbi:hypothetical protein JCM3775_003765 [Rhodotorula graminis]